MLAAVPPSPKRDANRSYLTPRGKALEWITGAHRTLYRLTGGLLGQTVLQLGERGYGSLLRRMNVLLLTTRGRTSGLLRTVPLPYYTYDGRDLLAASFSGSDRHPAWYLNLVDTPEVGVQRGRRRYRARAVPLEGDERERYWARFADDWPRYRVYQQGTSRTIPLVELVPLG
jgi:F420H(2)-dependent quinone reductase